jgi:hypothetical protein
VLGVAVKTNEALSNAIAKRYRKVFRVCIWFPMNGFKNSSGRCRRHTPRQ